MTPEGGAGPSTAAPSHSGHSMPAATTEGLSVEESVSQEILRKLRLANQADTKDDAGVVCEEVFFDICGQVDEQSRSRLRLFAPDHQPLAFYEVLARHCAQAPELAAELLSLCQSLWGHPYAASIYVLLLHRWLLSERDAGGSAQRTKHIGVMALSARNLFMGDIQNGTLRVRPLYRFLAEEVSLAQPGSPGRLQLDLLEPAARTSLLAVVAAVLPYYAQPHQMHDLLSRFPPAVLPGQAPSSASSWGLAAAAPFVAYASGGTSGGHKRTNSASSTGSGQQQQQPLLGAAASTSQVATAATAAAAAPEPPAGSGADFMVQEVTNALRAVRLELSVLKYLAALAALQGSPHTKWLSSITKLGLQDELYSLTSSGGPHYHGKAVRAAAMHALDCLFPLGKRSRNFVRFFFRLIHPSDWLGTLWTGPMHWCAALYGKAISATVGALYGLVVWRPHPPAQAGMGGRPSLEYEPPARRHAD